MVSTCKQDTDTALERRNERTEALAQRVVMSAVEDADAALAAAALAAAAAAAAHAATALGALGAAAHAAAALGAATDPERALAGTIHILGVGGLVVLRQLVRLIKLRTLGTTRRIILVLGAQLLGHRPQRKPALATALAPTVGVDTAAARACLSSSTATQAASTAPAAPGAPGAPAALAAQPAAARASLVEEAEQFGGVRRHKRHDGALEGVIIGRRHEHLEKRAQLAHRAAFPQVGRMRIEGQRGGAQRLLHHHADARRAKQDGNVARLTPTSQHLPDALAHVSALIGDRAALGNDNGLARWLVRPCVLGRAAHVVADECGRREDECGSRAVVLCEDDSTR
jgi:hypothetical protein